MDVDARIQVFDLKTIYQFQTVPNVDQYNIPLYNIQASPILTPLQSSIGMYPVYQGFTGNCFINGVAAPFFTDRSTFFNTWPYFVQPLANVATGDDGATYTINLPIVSNIQTTVNQQASGLLRGHVDITGIIATGNNADPIIASTINPAVPSTSIIPAVYFTSIDSTGASVVVQDSGQFLTGNVNYGLLMEPGPAPYGYSALPGGYSTSLNTINYSTGIANVTFPVNIPDGQIINAQCYYYNPGLPRAVLYYNNILTFRNVPDTQYNVQLDAYLTPAAFLATGQSIQFAYMCEYIARGAARKILADTGDTEQFAFYEPLFREQEMLVWKRSQRQFTATRSQTIYSQNNNGGYNGNYNISGLT